MPKTLPYSLVVDFLYNGNGKVVGDFGKDFSKPQREALVKAINGEAKMPEKFKLDLLHVEGRRIYFNKKALISVRTAVPNNESTAKWIGDRIAGIKEADKVERPQVVSYKQPSDNIIPVLTQYATEHDLLKSDSDIEAFNAWVADNT